MGGDSRLGLGIDLVALRAQIVQLMSTLERMINVQQTGHKPMASSNVVRRAELQLSLSIQDILAATERDMAISTGGKEVEQRIRNVFDTELKAFFDRPDRYK